MRISCRCLQQPILSIGLLFALIAAFQAGCSPKLARVTVSQADQLRANEVSREGDVAFSRKDFYAALIKYLEAVRLNPNSENVFNRLGIAYSQLRLYTEAKGAFLRSMELNPKFPYAVNNLGSVFFAERNLRKAEKYFKKAINLKENEASFHVNLGSLYIERKKSAKAMAEWRRSLALDPDAFSKSSAVSLTGAGNSSPMDRSFYIARLYATAGDVELAIENLKLAVAQGFSDVEAIKKQPDFDSIRKDPRFEAFMKEIELLIKLRSKVGLPAVPPSVFPNK